MKARSRWVMNWDEVAVFDKNATSMGIEEIELMRAAGDSLAQAASAMAESGDILFLCGPGNNGGDGFVIARLLHQKRIPVEVICLQGERSLDCAKNAQIVEKMGIPIHRSWPEGCPGMVVDALFGTGLSLSLIHI